MGKFGANLEEDVAGHRNTSPATGSPIEGRTRMKNAARLRLNVIDVDPQHREEFSDEGIANLAESLKQHGQLQPIRVRYDEDRGRYVLIAGERRLRAMKLAGWDEADAVIAEGDLNAKDILVQQILENLQREDLKPIERANAFKSLIDQHGWDQKQLAAELCVSEGTVSNALKLLKLDDETQAKVDSGELKATVAISSARKSRRSAGKKSRKPEPMTIRAASGKITIEPKIGKTHEDVLNDALAALRDNQRGAA
jgi:ParB family chromosome partitioning protein